MTETFVCNCKSEFQDSLYGKNVRVFNSTGKADGKVSGYRCTVCGREIRMGETKKK